MDAKNIGLLVITGLVCLGIGIMIGQPYPVYLEDMERASLENACEGEKASIQRTLERDCDRQVEDFLDRNKDLAEKNSELIEAQKEIDQKWQEVFKDFNHTVAQVSIDINKSITDLNCRR